MSGDRHKEIVRHISTDNLDRLLAESTDEKLTERLVFLKRIYKGATLEDLLTTSAGPPLRERDGLVDGTRVVFGC